MVGDAFPPLQGAIAQNESWTRYLNARRPDSPARRPEDIAASVDAIVSAVATLGETLPMTWSLTFDNLLRPGTESWSTVQELETIRQEVRRLFFTAREAMDKTRQVAEALQAQTGRKPAAMDRLLTKIDNARRLEEAVFRDWPSFSETMPVVTAADAAPVDESLAQALGVTVEEARQRLDARQRELQAGRG